MFCFLVLDFAFYQRISKGKVSYKLEVDDLGLDPDPNHETRTDPGPQNTFEINAELMEF